MSEKARQFGEQFTVSLESETDFVGWRAAARALALAGTPSSAVTFLTPSATSQSLFAEASSPLPRPDDDVTFSISKVFVQKAETASHHSDPDRYNFLYHLLVRVLDEPNLMKIASDSDIRRLEAMVKSVRRDAHKMHAFVRFRKIGDADATEDDGRYVAWFEPDHFIVEREAGFFMRRFAQMNWSILTPKGSIHWDRETLSVGPPAKRSDAPADDATEELWRTYFSNIFNPARLKVKAMQAEMPKKYWKNMPEAALIPDLIAGAENRAKAMVAAMPTIPPPTHAAIRERHWSAEMDDTGETPPPPADDLESLRKQSETCRLCPLHEPATQTVFGEGPANARLVFVGEQPGDKEDIAGKPFIGPAGQLFDATLEDAGIDRSTVYVTNAVKHFKFQPRGKFRLHQKPNGDEIQTCRWWLGQELKLIDPDLTVALGATAAQSLLGRSVAVTKERGQLLESREGQRVFITVHPSFLLRIPDEKRKAEERDRFRDDMIAVRELMAA
ncbi:UdgX family uracil-DNA binding protein [Notoacmeibacter sp. MSK16QG-6]|uniref:UdgX family uracil-DNA binding protein n=1 Tax=Notoacmeibacter sp. MSK16QG-6 TaxID=2957982 RepID=UPI0020A132FE|nr:UdgX family uracil-DNA binding protein [Notoacmeibacter sp. MSK16QG-6]MCP1200316.1 UdgX family uracil-DNA binding protein [Notoacmeibacter sp. MSK16QG-6]